jgi:hypothetical protein
MSTHFGARVVGKDAYDKAVRENKGGGNVFGKRVRDSITEAGPVGEKKRATEHGPLVVNMATAQDTKGKVTDGLAVEQIKSILAENPTFFDSLYEAELARPEGARPDALEVFLQVEIGIKGAGREEIIGEIRGLLGQKKVTAAQQADQNRLHLQQRDEMAQRSEENAMLADADRVRSLARREEDLALVKKSRASKTDQSAARPLMMDSQRAEMGSEIDGGNAEDDSRLAHPRTPSKPDGDTNPETQQPGERLGVPKGTSGEGDTGNGEGGEDDEQDAEEKRLNKLDRKALAKEAKKLKIDTDEIDGSGADGAVLKKDLVQAILAKQQEK